MALGCFALCANAQELEQKLAIKALDQLQGIIPAHFTKDNRVDNFWSATYKKLDKYGEGNVINELSIYDKSLDIISKITPSNGIIPISYQDAESDFTYIPATQELFDNDNAYEYIVPTSFDKDYNVISIAIVQEDGTILTTIPFGSEIMWLPWLVDNETPIKVYKIFDNLTLQSYYYLSIQLHGGSRDDGSEYKMTRIYSFEKGKISTSIKKVRDTPRMKVFPTLPQKNENIKIDLADMKSPNNLSVIDTNGKVCFTQTIQANQKNVELSTSGMSAGMYIIRVTDGNKEVDNCRVIIR